MNPSAETADHKLLPPSAVFCGWPVAAFLFGWGLAIRVLWPEWDLNPQYQYGQIMPLLCLALFWRRWRDRPPALPPAGFAVRITLTVAIASAVLLAAIQPVFEANPEWRLLGGLGAAAAAAMALAGIYQMGGRAWLAHFAFPILFFLVAVPWPRSLETAVMEVMMRGNATLAVELLHWSGREAQQQGNIILLPTGALGIEEACSGIRSLQSGLMAALFFGELFRLRLTGRVVLLVAAALIAVSGNLVRSVALAVIASGNGISAVHAWHDPAGVAILVATVAVVGGLGWWMARNNRTGRSAQPSQNTAGSVALVSWRFAAAGALGLWVITLIATEAWYRYHERDSMPEQAWSIRASAPKDGVQNVPIAERTLNILQYPKGFSERWMDAEGLRWQIFYFQWPSGRMAAQAAKIHDPKVCLGAIGMQLEGTLGTSRVEAEDLALSFNTFLFRDRGIPLYVFHGVFEDFEDKGGRKVALEDYSVRSRLVAVAAGRRNRGQRVLEVAVWGASGLEEARHGLRSFLERNLETSL